MLDPDAPGVDRLREVLASRGFFKEDLDSVLGASFASGHLRSDLPVYRRRLASPTPVHTLVKLFGLYLDVSEDDAHAFLREPAAKRAAKATGATGHDRDPVAQSLHQSLPTGDRSS